MFRGGESQYRLNDKLVRLKEIKDMLADTGLGVRAYSVIEQGRIGQILSGKPQERRRLIEEAAGVTRYKQRKRLAELKLEEATANRMRLDDIISEVERALRSLKRQSNAARRFKARDREYKELLNRVLRARWSGLQIKLRELQEGVDQATDHDAQLAAELSRAEAALAQQREQLDQLNNELNRHRSKASDCNATIEGRQEFLKGAKQTLQEVTERLTNGKTVATQRQRELETHLQTIQKLAVRKQELASEREVAGAALQEDEERVTGAEQALALVESEQEELRSRMMVSLGELNTQQSRHHRLQIDLLAGLFELGS